MTTKHNGWVRAKKIVEGMESWTRDINTRTRRQNDGRTANEWCFDAGVFAASELVRRLTGDDELSLAIHEMCIWRQREHAKEKARQNE